MSFEQRLEKPPIASFGFFSRKTMVSERPGDFSVAGPLASEGPSGRMEGLRRPCRCQPLCLLEPSPGAATCAPLPCGGLPGSRRWGQLDAFSRWGWLGFSGCLARPRSNLLRPLAPSWGTVLLRDPLARASDSSESPGSEVGPWSPGVQGVVGEEGLGRLVRLLKAMPGDTSLLLQLVDAKESDDRPMAGGQEVRPAVWGLGTTHSGPIGLGLA